MELRPDDFGRELERMAEERGTEVSRRSVLKAGVIGGALLGAGARVAHAWQGLPSTLLRLVRRLNHGHSIEEWNLAQSLGHAAYLDHHLDPASITENPTLEGYLNATASYGAAPEDMPCLFLDGPNHGSIVTAGTEAQFIKGLQNALSNRGGENVMTEFWSNHFNVFLFEGLHLHLNYHEESLIRPYALGSFPELLLTTMSSPAMSIYLDNQFNRLGKTNENYARELLELHTLGIGHYQEEDVRAVTRCLTGWEWNNDRSDPNDPLSIYCGNEYYGHPRFDINRHELGDKTFLGNTINNPNGVGDGIEVRDIVVDEDATHEFITRKLIGRLLTSTPSQTLVNQVKAVWVATDGNIEEMVREILKPSNVSTEFTPRFTTNYDFGIQLVRAVPADFTLGSGFLDLLKELDAEIAGWPSPDGRPADIQSYVTQQAMRFRAASRYFHSGDPTTDPSTWLGGVTLTDAKIQSLFAGFPKSQWAYRADAILTGGANSLAVLNPIQTYINSEITTTSLRRVALVLVVMTPAFQYA